MLVNAPATPDVCDAPSLTADVPTEKVVPTVAVFICVLFLYMDAVEPLRVQIPTDHDE
jgi:hypothetical protein